jgi:hypothetical protein
MPLCLLRIPTQAKLERVRSRRSFASIRAVAVSFTGLPAQIGTVSVCGTGGLVTVVLGSGSYASGTYVPTVGIITVTNQSCSALPVTTIVRSLSNPSFFSALSFTNFTSSGTVAASPGR